MRAATEREFEEAAVPGISAIRASERQNRAVALLGLTREVCGFPVVPFAPRHRLALAASGCGFVIDGDGGPEDVFQVLWHLSPWWDRREGPESLRAEGERIRIKQLVVEVVKAEAAPEMSRQVRVFLASQFADAPELSGDEEGGQPDYSDHVSWYAIEASFWMNVHGGFTLESYGRTPYLVLQQLRRAWKVNNPDRVRLPNGDHVVDHPIFRNSSDRLIADHHAARRSVIALAILGRTERLPS